MSKPLVEAMQKYLQDRVYPFHTPGHKGGRGMDGDMLYLLQHGAQIDVSLMEELDDLHSPCGVIAQAQELAAKLYGSDACFWCVNGTTLAIQAMVLSVAKPGDQVLVARNSHLSVFNALTLAGAEPVCVIPEYNAEFGIQTQVTSAAVAQALEQNEHIKAVLITSPNYYGIVADVAAIADLCHARGIPLLVDEAHGAHLGFSDGLPKGALRCGADLVAHSTHKVMGAMTQASMLHVKSKIIASEKVADGVALLTTTSPNYLLMASLDAAREQFSLHGEEYSQKALLVSRKLREALQGAGFKVLLSKQVAPLELDTTRVLLNLNNMDLTGPELAAVLRREGVAVEMVDAKNVLFLLTYADDNPRFYDVLMRLRKFLPQLVRRHMLKHGVAPVCGQVPAARRVLALQEVFHAAKEKLPLEQCVGRVSGEMVAFYPPGVPVLLPGEEITPEVVTYLVEQRKSGLVVKGAADSSLETLRVVQNAG